MSDSNHSLPPAAPLTVGFFLAHLEAGKGARELGDEPGVNTLGNLCLSWFGEGLTAETFKRLRFEGALRLGRYLDGNDSKSIDSVSIRTLALMLRAAKDRFGNLSLPPIEAIENADAAIRTATTATNRRETDEEAAPDPAGRERSRRGTKKRGGRPLTSDPAKDKKLFDDWKASGLSAKQFARHRGIKHADVEAGIKRHRERERRRRESAS